MSGVSSASSLGSCPQHADVRAEPLVGRAGERVAAERGDVDRPVRRGVHRVDVDARAGRVGGVDDAAQVGDRADRVGGVGDRDPAGLVGQHRLDGARRQLERSGSGSAKRIAPPLRSAWMTHGRTLASWSRRVTTTSSPGSQRAPDRPREGHRQRRHVGTEDDLGGGAPSNAPARRGPREGVRRCGAAANTPPWLALRPERIQASIATIALSTICVPAGREAGPAPSARPGKRSRFTRSVRPRPHELGVVRVGEQLDGLRRRQPAQLVDLVVGLEALVLRLHQPVAHDLGAALAVA